MARRERTRQLIEMGALVHEAGLVDLTEDDRAVLFGGLLQLAAQLRSDDGPLMQVRWRQRGMGALTANRQSKTIERVAPSPDVGSEAAPDP